MYKKRAQISSTMNWVVATIIIIVILGLSISASEFSKKSRGFSYNEDITPHYSLKLKKGITLLGTKSLINFLLTEDNFKKIINQKELSKKQESLQKNITKIHWLENGCNNIKFFCFIAISLKNPGFLRTSITGSEYIQIPLNKEKSIYFTLHKSYI